MKVKSKMRILSAILCLVLFLQIPLFAFSIESIEEEIYIDSMAESEYTDDVEILEEDISLRGEFEKHFLQSDGTYLAVSYGEPVHKQKTDGSFEEIDNTLSLKKGRFENADDDFNVSFAEKSADKLVELSSDGFSLSWGLSYFTNNKTDVVAPIDMARDTLNPTDSLATNTVTNTSFERITDDNAESAKVDARVFTDAKTAVRAEITKKENLDTFSKNERKLVVEKANSGLVYSNVLGDGIDARYTVAPGRVKEDIILNSPSDFSGYAMDIMTKSLTPILREDNSVDFVNGEGNPIFTVSAPFMYDAADDTSFDIVIKIEESEDGYRIIFTPDSEWLNAEERAYPIVIDPVTSEANGRINAVNTYVYSNAPTSNPGTGLQSLYVGKNSSGGICRTYWKVGTLPSGPTSATITSATFYVKRYGGESITSTNPRFSLYGVNASWTTSITYNTRPSSTSLVSNVTGDSSTQKVAFSGTNVTNRVKEWYAGTSANNGFMICYTTEPSANSTYVNFYSHNSTLSGYFYPTFTVTYTAPTQNIANGTYYIKSAYSNKYLTVDENTLEVVQRAFVGTPNQRWKVVYKSDGYYELTSPYFSEFTGYYSSTISDCVLDVVGAGNTNNTRLQIYTPNASNAQRFMFIDSGSGTYRIIPKCATSKVLDVKGPSTADNTPIQLWDWADVNQQKWKFEECVQIYQTEKRYILNGSQGLPDDFDYSSKTQAQIISATGSKITTSDFNKTVAQHRSAWESVAQLTCTSPLQTVALDMISHFMGGSMKNYTNATLTQKAKDHPNTQTYISGVKTCFDSAIKDANGNVKQLQYSTVGRDNIPMVNKMKSNTSTKTQPSFNSNSDYLTCLAFCVHSWWGNEIIVRNYSKSGNTYTATLTFVIYDHFGLDKTDITDGKYPTNFLPGLKSWYILQHYNNSSYFAYAPFVTIISFDIPVSGTL